MIKVAKMVERRSPNVLSYFTHRIANAAKRIHQRGRPRPAEARLRQPQLQQLSTAMLLRCGGLDLCPAT
jgi:hypothetical protein